MVYRILVKYLYFAAFTAANIVPYASSSTSSLSTTAGATSTVRTSRTSTATSKAVYSHTSTHAKSTKTSKKHTRSSSARCVTTKTYTTSIAQCSTTGSLVTVTNTDNAYVIEADTLTIVSGTATATVSVTTTKTRAKSATSTFTKYPTVKTGSAATVTAPPPTGFVPIQSSLPNATYHLSGCLTTIVTETAIITGRSPPKTTTTFAGVVIASAPSGSINYAYYSASDFTNFKISYVTVVSTSTVYPGTVTKTSVFSSTVTEAASTTTRYAAACATNNFADGIVVDNGKVSENFINGFTTGPVDFESVASASGSPEACCHAAFERSALIWVFGSTSGCSIFVDGSDSCPAAPLSISSVVYSPQALNQGYVFGNGPCGQWGNAIEESPGEPTHVGCF